MSDAADIFGQPVTDPDEARESFLAGGSGVSLGGDLGGAGLRFIVDPTVPLGEVHFRHPNGRIDKIVNMNRECGQGTYGDGTCELGLDHPGACLMALDACEYAATGRVTVWAIVDKDSGGLRKI